MALSRLARSKDDALTTGNDLTLDYPASATSITIPYDGILHLCVAVSAASVFYVRHNGVNLALNSNSALVADSLYTFDFAVASGDTISFRIGTNCTIRQLIVDFTPSLVN